MSKCKPKLDHEKIKEITVRTKRPMDGELAKERESPGPPDRTKTD